MFGHGGILTSEDGRRWIAREVPTSVLLRDVVVTRREVLAIGSGGIAMTSPDGPAWRTDSTPTHHELEDALVVRDEVILVDLGGTILSTRDRTRPSAD